MPTLSETLIFVTGCHGGQLDKAGEPYILHPLRVMGNLGHNAPLEERQIALLHDVMEDCEITEAHLREMGYSERVVDAVACLTKTLEEQLDKENGYAHFIERCGKNPLAAKVKLADIADNKTLRLKTSGFSYVFDIDIHRTLFDDFGRSYRDCGEPDHGR